MVVLFNIFEEAGVEEVRRVEIGVGCACFVDEAVCSLSMMRMQLRIPYSS